MFLSHINVSLSLSHQQTFFKLKKYSLEGKENFTGPADVEANTLSHVFISSPKAQRRMEAETGGKTADAGQSWGEGKAGEHCRLKSSCLIHFKDNKPPKALF